MKKIIVPLSVAIVALFGGCISKTDVKVTPSLKEELSDAHLEVTGQIPSWLIGSLLRNGPVAVAIDGKTNHWLDGLAMLHAFSFHEGKVDYTNKFLHTDAYETVFKKHSLDYDGFTSDPCRSLFKRLFTAFFPKASSLHNANVNIAKMADQYVALTEVPLPVRFDPKTLETLGVLDYEDKLPHAKCWESAHPHVDFSKKETISYLIDYGKTSTYTLYKMKDGSLTREIVGKIPVEEPSYMHSFALTQNYVIFTAFPFVVKPLDFITKNKPFIKNFRWEPERGTQFIVVNRKTGEVLGSYKTKPFFAFHHANAFEKEGTLYVDIVCYDNPSVIDDVADHAKTSFHPENPGNLRVERFKLSLKSGLISSEILFDKPVEFPKVNGFYDGLPYRYLYVIDPRDRVTSRDLRPIYKIDTETKEVTEWVEKGCYPGEPIFVPAPNATSEDEGVCLVVVLDEKDHRSFLLVLDGKTFKEMARAKVPHAIPPGLHGQHYPTL